MTEFDAVREAVPPAEAARYEAEAPARRRGWPAAWRTAVRLSYAGGAVLLFGLALELLKSGARGLAPLLNALSVQGDANALGFGWLGAELALSGSPVAATALSLFAGGVLTAREAFFMLNGSRLGASFIVLLVGFLYYLRGRRQPDGIYIGVIALLTTATIYVPSMALGGAVLRAGWLDGVRFGPATSLDSVTDLLYGPLVTAARDGLPQALIFALGLGALLLSFQVFDRALPSAEAADERLARFADLLHRPLLMFGVGMLVTSITLSVSLSLTILVPLSLAGLIRRDHTIPYVMGANITTFIDTLFAALLLREPVAFTIVLTQMLAVAAVSLAVLLGGYGPYRRAVLWCTRRVTHSRRSLAAFLALLFLVPGLLLAL